MLIGPRARPADAPPSAASDPAARNRALRAAAAYGRAARALRASPHLLARIVRDAPAADPAVRRACVWAALGAYFGGSGPAAPPAPPASRAQRAPRAD